MNTGPYREALFGVGGRDDNLVEHAGLAVGGGAELADLPRQVGRHLAVERHDAAERGDGVGAHGGAVRQEPRPGDPIMSKQ